ncbi:hypothetical protein J4E81_006518 [Alternaria sp. BMP 2799]|nr:hypothetical protein J4E81_006518 [Alternaria sp. BMP 2799]
MPTRILEVSEDKIRLRCDIATKPYEYLVLSHMWGQNYGQQLLLKEANIEEFKRDIPMQKLGTSATFREAIRVTRTLGYRYIWIDSLCIIQDSKSDWDYEATRMATVTFQEYLLSPRTLLLGHKNLMYQCSQFFYDELLGPIGSSPNPSTTTSVTPETPSLDTDLCKSKYFPPSLSNLSKLSSSDPCAPVLLSFLRNWLSLINEYRARNLSFGKDRIIAIAGIARAFAHLGNLTYLAGLWRECLPVTLLWAAF